jgi:hypothetical protein
MSTALIAVEGVLGERSTLHGFHPIVDGIRLARALRSEYQLVLATTQADDSSVEFWLKINGMGRPSFYESLSYRESRWADLSDPDLLGEQAAQLRSSGADLNLVVSSDPLAVLGATGAGFPALFFVDPTYRWAEYRPDRKRLPKPWQDIDDEMTRQLELKNTDPRLNEMEPETA